MFARLNIGMLNPMFRFFKHLNFKTVLPVIKFCEFT